MQTFLPFPSYSQSAQCLDNRRLGKQRAEAKQILKALKDPTYGWQHHPAVKMWRGYDESLREYLHHIIQEWESRGFNHWSGYPKFQASASPHWLTEEFCSRHRAALFFKDPKWYSQFNWTEIPQIDYLWPEGK